MCIIQCIKHIHVINKQFWKSTAKYLFEQSTILCRYAGAHALSAYLMCTGSNNVLPKVKPITAPWYSGTSPPQINFMCHRVINIWTIHNLTSQSNKSDTGPWIWMIGRISVDKRWEILPIGDQSSFWSRRVVADLRSPF